MPYEIHNPHINVLQVLQNLSRWKHKFYFTIHKVVPSETFNFFLLQKISELMPYNFCLER